MALRYTYKEYQDFPEATDISESRERGKACLLILGVVLIIASIICMIVDFSACWPMVFVLFGAILLFVYLFTKYDKITEHKIDKAITEKIELKEYAKNARFICDYIKPLGEKKIGKCLNCYKTQTSVTQCEIKNNIGKRNIPICDECLSNFQPKQ